METPSTITAGNLVDLLESELAGHDLYYGHGTEDPGAEAAWLVTAVLRQDTARVTDEITADTPVSAAQQARIRELLQSRIRERLPLAYLLHEAWFAGLCFYVDERVLVPRSPIAELVGNRFQPLLAGEPRTILDLCCGSGCIGIACALAFPDSIVVLADNSPDALAVAELNIRRFGLQARVSTRLSDLFDDVPERFDLIVANPPYVSGDEYHALPAEYLMEPKAGLVCDDDGLAIPLRILATSADHLADDGVLVLETGFTWPALEAAAPDLPFLWLDFEFGGEGVCALTAEQLRRHGQNSA